jgi:sodium transport system permease protein
VTAVLHVFRKEILDNARDRRTLFSALVFGPLFGPALFAVLVTLTLEKTLSKADEALALPVTGAEHAANLMAFLERSNLKPRPGPANLDAARRLVKTGAADVVLWIESDFGAAVTSGEPARVTLVFDQSNNQAQQSVARVQRLLEGYSARLGALRLQVRGVNPWLVRPITVDQIDVSTATGRSVVLLGMLTYFLLFAMLMGGLYLAIDTTAGERERGSLEPLLTLPVPRGELLLGKLLATVFYMLLSLLLTLAAFVVALPFVPLERLGMAANFTVPVALATFGVLAPFALLGAGLMTVVASFTKSYKEAQTYLTVVLLVPTLPIMFAAIAGIKPNPTLMWIPSLSQHLLVTDLIKAEPINVGHALLSGGSTLVLGILLAGLAIRLYCREGVLG